MDNVLRAGITREYGGGGADKNGKQWDKAGLGDKPPLLKAIQEKNGKEAELRPMEIAHKIIMDHLSPYEGDNDISDFDEIEDAIIQAIEKERQEIARLDHLHKLDHSLADQWQKKNEKLEAELAQVKQDRKTMSDVRYAWKDEVARLQEALDASNKQLIEAMEMVKNLSAIDKEDEKERDELKARVAELEANSDVIKMSEYIERTFEQIALLTLENGRLKEALNKSGIYCSCEAVADYKLFVEGEDLRHGDCGKLLDPVRRAALHPKVEK